MTNIGLHLQKFVDDFDAAFLAGDMQRRPLTLDKQHHLHDTARPVGPLSTLHNVGPASRGVDPYGTGGTRPPNILTGGHYHECPPQYFWSNISYFLSVRYFLDKLKEFLVLILEVNLVSVSGQCCGVSSD